MGAGIFLSSISDQCGQAAGSQFVFVVVELIADELVEHAHAQHLDSVSFCGGLGLIREKEGQIQLMYLGCGRSLKKGNFVLESDHDVYAAIYMQHGVWYYSATGPVRVKIGKETKELNEGYNQKL